jgi:hypothetical protein
MIDTLKLRLDDATFKPNCDIENKLGTDNLRRQNEAPPILYKAGDVVVRAFGAFHNGEQFNLDISARPFDTSIVDTTVHFSVASVANGGNNYQLTDLDGTHSVFIELQEWLNEIGVVADVLAGVPTRCDLTKNIEADENYRDYQPIYGAMTTGRLDGHDYGTGYLWENTAQQIAAYSKIDEMALKAKKKRHNFDASLYPENVQRLEWRCFGRKVQAALKVQRAGDILDGYGSLGVHYRKAMKTQLFKRSPSEKKQLLTVADARIVVRQFIEAEERFWFEKFWASLPFAFLSESDLAAIVTAVKEESPNRNTPSRVKSKIAAYKMDALKAHNVKSGKTAADLYRELEQKVLAE